MKKFNPIFFICLLLVLTLHLTPCTLHCYAAERGLVAYWSFDEGKGQISEDLSGNRHDAVINGAAWEKDGIGFCLSFDGALNLVEVKHANDLGLTTAGTVMFWMKASGSNSAWQNVIHKWGGDSRNYGIYLNVDNGNLAWSASYRENPAPFSDAASGFIAWDDTWHHIAVVFNGSEPKVAFYVDGSEYYSADPGFAEMKTNNEALAIGDHFPGMMDEVKIYNRALTSEEIEKYYFETSKRLGETPKEKKSDRTPLGEKKVEKAVPAKTEKKKEAGPKGLVSYYGFEPNDPEEWAPSPGGTVTAEKKEVISGKSSMEGNSMGSSSDWNEFFHSDPAKLPFEGGKTYTVYFKYKVLDKGDSSKSYFLMRSTIGGAPGPSDKGWTDITEEPGEEGAKTITFALDDFPDYLIIIGIYKQSSIVIDDLAVFEGEVDEGMIESVIKDLNRNKPKEQKEPIKKEVTKEPIKDNKRTEVKEPVEPVNEEWRALYVPGGGFWSKRIGIDLQDVSGEGVAGEPVDIKIGRQKGEIGLAGFEAREVRVCDDRGNEFIFSIYDAKGIPLREGKIPEGGLLTIPAELKPGASKRYYVYFDNPSAWLVPDYFEITREVRNNGFEEKTWWEWAGAQRVTDKYYSGAASARLEADGSNGEGPYTLFMPVPESTSSVLTVSFMYDIDITDGRYWMSVFHYDKNGNAIPRAPGAAEGHSDIFTTDKSTNGWKKFSITMGQSGSGADFILPEGTAKMKLRGCFWDADGSNTGIAWLDDFNIEGIEKNPSNVRASVKQLEKMDLRRSAAVKPQWLSDQGKTWEYRMPVEIRNFASQDISNSMLFVNTLRFRVRMKGLATDASIRVADAEGRIIPHSSFTDNVVFSGSCKPFGAGIYYIYASKDPGITGSSSGPGDLAKSKSNLVKNPDFEEGEGLPAGWRSEVEVGKEGDQVIYSKDPNVKYEWLKAGISGNRCVKMEVSPDAPSAWRGWRQIVPVKPGKSYFYGGYVKTENIEGEVRMHIHFLDKSGKLCGTKFFATPDSLKGTNDWTMLTAMLTTPPDCVSVEIHLTMDARGTIYHDTVVLCEAMDAVAGNIESLIPSKEGIAAWQVNPIIKVFQDDPARETPKEFSISSARNEKEPLQVAIRSAKDLKGVNVRVELPADEAGAKLQDFKIERIGFVPCDVNSNYFSSDLPSWRRNIPNGGPGSDGWPGIWPDPVLPLRQFDLPANTTQPVLITASIPKNAKPGDYTGKVIIESGGKPLITAPFRIKVWDFELPDESHLTALFDLGNGPGWSFLDMTNRKLWYKLMAEHRVCANAIEPGPVINYSNGRVTLDTTEFDKMAKYYFDDLKMNKTYLPGIFYSFGWGFEPRGIYGFSYPSEGYKEAYQTVLKAVWEHVKEKGWDKKFLLYISDEPDAWNSVVGKRMVEQMKGVCDIIHEAAPDVNIYSSTWRFVPEWVGYLDVWGVGNYGCFPVDEMERRLKDGDKLWFTTDGTMCLNTPYNAIERLYPYFCFKYGVSAYEFWDISWWTYDPFKFGWHTYLPHVFKPGDKPIGVRYPNGDGFLTYPGWLAGETGPLSSVRFEQVREGMEDYEYMYILKNRIDAAKKKSSGVQAFSKTRQGIDGGRLAEAEAALEKARALVTIPNAGGTNSTKILPDPDAVLKIREEMARAILGLAE